jgi:hypothetical protein
MDFVQMVEEAKKSAQQSDRLVLKSPPGSKRSSE